MSPTFYTCAPVPHGMRDTYTGRGWSPPVHLRYTLINVIDSLLRQTKKRNTADFRERTLTRTIPLFKIQQDSFDSPLSAGGYVAVLMNSLLPIGRLPVTTYSPPLTYENAANLLALRLSLFGPSVERGWLHYLLCERD